jgi:signal transduction histidine kinase
VTVGTFTIASTDESGRRYHEADLDLAMEISARAAVALENAQLYASERKAREDAEEARRIAEEASRTKSQFLAVMSHELRTPLNAIGGYAQLLELGVHGSMTDSQLESVRRLKRSQQNLLALIEDLLSFAKLDTGKVEYRFANVPLDKTLNEIETLVKPQLDAKGLHYDYCRVDPDVTIWADSDKFEQIILNLLTNAIKFTREGSVRIDCRVSRDDAKISVSDTGIGIADEKLELIFDPFVQVHSGLTRTSTGSGLGLAISRDLARAMGGDITVKSEEGKGSTFTLTVPTHEPA